MSERTGRMAKREKAKAMAGAASGRRDDPLAAPKRRRPQQERSRGPNACGFIGKPAGGLWKNCRFCRF